MTDRIDIGNVRGIQGEKGDKGERGSTPSYKDLKYEKENDEFVALLGTGTITQHYLDFNGNLCDEQGHLLDANGEPTSTIGVPFDIDEYGYAYKPVWVDSEGNFTNENGERLDDEGNVIYVESSFISDILSYLYGDEEGYNKLVTDIYPNVVDTLVSADPNDAKFKNFFDEIEGDIKYYICEDNPKNHIYLDDTTLVNTCRYKNEDGSLVLDDDDNYAYVPLEKNALYLYNNSGLMDNDIMHYDIYLCRKANTVPIKLVSASDFTIDYNVIDDLEVYSDPSNINDVDDYDVYIELLTRGTRGQFYSMEDVDTLFMNNLINKLGANNGIAQLNNTGKVPSSQLPAYIDDVVEGTMNSNATTFTPSDSDYIDSVKQKGKIYVDTSTRKTYRWTGSQYVFISNPVVVDNGTTEAYGSAKGTALENKIGSDSLNTTSQTVIGAINEHETDISSLNSGKANTSHTHGNLQSNGQVGSTAQASKNVVTDANGKITTENKPTIPSANSTATNIKMDGTQSAGSLTTFAKADHIHPSDTSKADTEHTHGNLQSDGQVGSTAQASKNVVTDANGKITTENKYSHPSSHASTMITESSALSNIGTSANANQHTINTAINTRIGNLSNINAIEVVSTKPTASASTMGRLYLVNENDDVKLYYTEATTSNGTTTYAWVEMSNALFSNLSVDWEDIGNKPSSFTPSTHVHGNLQSDGQVGSTAQASKNVVTDANGKITTENKYSHPSGTAKTGQPNANKTPAFGETFTVTQFTSNSLGHISGATDRTVKIPNTLADGTTAGLSTNDYTTTEKTKLSGIDDSANNYTHPTGIGTALTTATLKAIKYDSQGHITGVANPPSASTSASGIVKLSDATNSTSTTLGATANAVKKAYDLANSKSTVSVNQTKTSGIEIGSVTIDGTETKLYQQDNNTTYTGDRGISLVSGKFGHSNTAITAGTNYSSNQTPAFNGTFNIPKLTYDAYGHITASANSTVKIPPLPTASTSSAGIIQIGTGATNASAGNHVHGNIQNNGVLKVGGTTQASKNVVTDANGKITTENKYTHPSTHATSMITESSALSNLGTSANATQHDVNSAINTKNEELVQLYGRSNNTNYGASYGNKIDGASIGSSEFNANSGIVFTRVGKLVIVEYMLVSASSLTANTEYVLYGAISSALRPTESRKYFDLTGHTASSPTCRLMITTEGQVSITPNSAGVVRCYGSVVYMINTKTYN